MPDWSSWRDLPTPRGDDLNPATTPVLLVVHETKLPTLPRVIESLVRYGGFTSFDVVCPPQVLADAERRLRPTPVRLRITDEEQIIPGLSSAAMADYIPPQVPGWPSRPLCCWYYQQFLKMAFSRFIGDADYYLMWDADTVLARPVRFYEQQTLLTASSEYHRDYFRTIARLFPDVAIPRCSHISQHALVSVADMRALLDELSAHGLPWWQYILSSMVGRSAQRFSEYETYAAYCLTRWPDRYRTVRRRWLRNGRAYFGASLQSADISGLAGLYDFIAFEDWDVGSRRRRHTRIRVAKDRLAAWSDRVFGWTWYPG